jgi:hypothetical protein
MPNTDEQYQEVINSCRDLFEKKTVDYGTSWRIMRLPTITDQIFIKAQRIRTIQESKVQKVKDSIYEEFIGIINYCLIALIQAEYAGDEMELDPKLVMELYDNEVHVIKALLANKNHDYGEAWRDMRISSMTDLILMKLIRIKSIEDNFGKTIVSEGIQAGYQDIVNYAVFCLIKMNENGARI